MVDGLSGNSDGDGAGGSSSNPASSVRNADVL
jgi:hypothetical protein